MSKLTIMIDLDGTLKTEHDAKGPFDVDSIIVNSGSKKYTFGIRPHVHDFLSEAKKIAKLYLGTAGGGGYARRITRAMNIDKYFDEIIAAENFNTGMQCFGNFRNTIYIDNDSEMLKLKILKIQSSYYFRKNPVEKQDEWIIDTFLGNKNDTTMLELIEEIKIIKC